MDGVNTDAQVLFSLPSCRFSGIFSLKTIGAHLWFPTLMTSCDLGSYLYQSVGLITITRRLNQEHTSDETSTMIGCNATRHQALNSSDHCLPGHYTSHRCLSWTTANHTSSVSSSQSPLLISGYFALLLVPHDTSRWRIYAVVLFNASTPSFHGMHVAWLYTPKSEKNRTSILLVYLDVNIIKQMTHQGIIEVTRS
ncbi:hypothetical protein BC941DRAFT_513805 [Chlamydoabsidia padenii]|nr:hypothetical protein BC941DRAFT_513805 [Chlamydoabsidia padenii]